MKTQTKTKRLLFGVEFMCRFMVAFFKCHFDTLPCCHNIRTIVKIIGVKNKAKTKYNGTLNFSRPYDVVCLSVCHKHLYFRLGARQNLIANYRRDTQLCYCCYNLNVVLTRCSFLRSNGMKE